MGLYFLSVRIHQINEVTIKIFTILHKKSVSNKCSFFSVHQIILEMLVSTTISPLIVVNVFWAAIRRIRMISEGSCDTKD